MNQQTTPTQLQSLFPYYDEATVCTKVIKKNRDYDIFHTIPLIQIWY